MTFCSASTVEGESERIRKKYRLCRIYTSHSIVEILWKGKCLRIHMSEYFNKF